MFLRIAFVLPLLLGCANEPGPGVVGAIGVCEQVATTVIVRTTDERPTIALVETESPCTVIESCGGSPPDGGVGLDCGDSSAAAAFALRDAGPGAAVPA
jgi:hypothetical protein